MPTPLPRVLVLDSEGFSRRFVTRLLATAGLTSSSAGSAEEALALIERGDSFDALWCELALEGMSGLDFLLELRVSAPEHAARVLIAGPPPLTDEERLFFALLGDRYLSKPIAPPAIVAAVVRVACRSSGYRAA